MKIMFMYMWYEKFDCSVDFVVIQLFYWFVNVCMCIEISYVTKDQKSGESIGERRGKGGVEQLKEGTIVRKMLFVGD